MDNFIPFSRPSIGDEEFEAVKKVLESGWLTVGSVVEEFETEVGKYLDTMYVAATDSCTSALTVGATAIRILYGRQKAYIPALTFIATANALVHAGFRLEFIDVDFDGNMDIDLIPDPIGLVVPVHFAGQPVDIEKLIVDKFWVLDDAAHAFGSSYNNKKIGGIREFLGSCFSFYPTKNITTVEGGAFTTNNKDLFEVAKGLSLHGLGTDHTNRYNRSSTNKPTAKYLGFKANMTNVEAAIGLEQLKKVDSFLHRKRQIAEIYEKELRYIEQLEIRNRTGHSWHMFILLVNNRDEVVQKLKAEGVGVGIHYSPIIPEHPVYKDSYIKGKDYPVATRISNMCLSLPIFPTMSDDDVSKVIDTVKRVV